ncbi:MAG: hypothetical protein RL281_1385 [Pseudomonadota bacterium]
MRHLQSMALPCHLRCVCGGFWQTGPKVPTMCRRISPPNLQGLPSKPTHAECVLGGHVLHLALGVAHWAVQISKPPRLGKAVCLVDAQHTLRGRRR